MSKGFSIRRFLCGISDAMVVAAMIMSVASVFGAARILSANSAGSVYTYQPPLVIDNTNAGDPGFHIFDRPRRLQQFMWNGKPYLMIDAGVDVLIYDPATGTEVTKGNYEFGNPPGQHGESDQVVGITVCDDCRYGVLSTTLNGVRIFDMGQGVTPNISQDWSYANTVTSGGTYLVQGQQYVLLKGGYGSRFFGKCSGQSYGVYTIQQALQQDPTPAACLDASFQPDFGVEFYTTDSAGGQLPFYIYHDAGASTTNIVALTPQTGQVPGTPVLPPIVSWAVNSQDPIGHINLDLRHMQDVTNPHGYILVCNSAADPAATLYKVTPDTDAHLNITPVQTFSGGQWFTGAVQYPYVFLMEFGSASAKKAFYDLTSGQPVEQDPDYWNNLNADFNGGPDETPSVFEYDAIFSPDSQWLYWARYLELARFKYTPKSPTALLTVTPSEVFWDDVVKVDGSGSSDAQQYAAWIDDDPTGVSTSANVVAGTQVLGSTGAGWQTGPPPNPTLTWTMPENATGPYYAHVAVQDVPNGYSYDPANHPEMLKTVQINFDTQPQAGFDAPASVVYSSTQATVITNTSQGNPTSYQWTVMTPGGGEGAFTGPDANGNISVIFDQAGDWEISLTANYKADGSYSSTAGPKVVTVKSAIASFTISPNPATITQKIYLTSTSQPADQLSYSWSVSNATAAVWTSTEQSPTIPAGTLVAGDYTVKLMVTNTQTQETDTATDTLTVNNPPQQALTISDTTPDIGQLVTFSVSGLTLNSNSVVNWNFGGTSCNPTQYPQQVTCQGAYFCDSAGYYYAHAGTYTVTVSGTDANGSFSVSGQVQVQASGQCSGTSCTYTVSPTSFSVGSSGASGLVVSVSTQSGCSWTASAGSTWLHITSGTSGSGSGSVVFNADAYSSGSRTGTLTVAGHTVSVSQSSGGGGGGGFTITPEAPAVCQSVTFTAPDGVTVKSWDFSHANCQGDPANAYGSSTCGMNPAACSSVTWSYPAAGTYTVTMTPVSGAPVSQQVTVTGSTVACNLSLSASSTQFGADGGSGTIHTGLDSSCSWTASSTASDWLHVTTASGSGDGPVQFTVDANTGSDQKQGTIAITSSGTTKSVTITEAGSGSSGSGSGVLSAMSLVAAAANVAGSNGTDWKTELCVYNPNPTAATFKIKLLPDMTNDDGGTVVPVGGHTTQAVDGLGTWCSDDVLASMGNGIKGALVVDLQDPANFALGLAVTSRTYTPSPSGAGTYGQFVPALPLQGTPVHQLILTGLHSWGDPGSTGYRANVGLANQSDQVVPRIYIKVYDASGTLVGKYQNQGSGDTFTSLGAHGFVQYDKILSKLDHPQDELHDFSIVITFTDVAGHATAEPVTAYATVVDNVTGDATFIPAVKVP